MSNIQGLINTIHLQKKLMSITAHRLHVYQNHLCSTTYTPPPEWAAHIPWHKAPAWAHYWAMDHPTSAYWYSHKPTWNTRIEEWNSTSNDLAGSRWLFSEDFLPLPEMKTFNPRLTVALRPLSSLVGQGSIMKDAE